MKHARNVRLFLVHGTGHGIIRAEVGQWSGRALVVPRTHLGDLAEHSEAQRTGVYILGGPDPAHDEREAVYVGEGDSIAKRVLRHDAEQDFWTRACLLTSTDDSLTKAHARYLEARLLQLAGSARRCSIVNEKTPALPALPAADRSDMEVFVAQAEILLPLLGFHLLQPIAGKSTADANAPSVTFAMTDVGVDARAHEVESQFVVLAGSTARAEGTRTWATGRSLREQLVEQGVLVSFGDGQFLRFAEDVPFTSPSTAASVVAATNMNGRTAWRLPDGVTYAEWRQARLTAGITG